MTNAAKRLFFREWSTWLCWTLFFAVVAIVVDFVIELLSHDSDFSLVRFFGKGQLFIVSTVLAVTTMRELRRFRPNPEDKLLWACIVLIILSAACYAVSSSHLATMLDPWKVSWVSIGILGAVFVTGTIGIAVKVKTEQA